MSHKMCWIFHETLPIWLPIRRPLTDSVRLRPLFWKFLITSGLINLSRFWCPPWRLPEQWKVVTSKCIMGFQATDCHEDKALGFIWRRVFSTVNYNNVYDGRWITTQYLRQTKENSKFNNGGFNKWLEILAGKDLQTKLHKIERECRLYTAQRRQTLSTRDRG